MKNCYYRKDGEKLKMISNRKFGPGSLSFTAFESIKVSFISQLTLFQFVLIRLQILISYISFKFMI